MNKKTKIIIAVVILGVIAAIVAGALYMGKSGDTQIPSQTEGVAEEAVSGTNKPEDNAAAEKQPENKDEKAEKPVATEEVKVNPTFMYFVDNSQEEATADMINELKKAYPDVVFDIKNVEKEPELLENFELVDGKTPALIMLDTSNNICGFEFMCTDKAKLEGWIKTALGQ